MKTKYTIVSVVFLCGVLMSQLITCKSPSLRFTKSKDSDSDGGEARRGDGLSGLDTGNVISALPTRKRSITDPDVHFLTPGMDVSSSLDGLLDDNTRSKFDAIMGDFVRQLKAVERSSAEIIQKGDENYLKLSPSAASLDLVDRTAEKLRRLPDGSLLAENFLRAGIAPELTITERHLYLEKVAPKENSESKKNLFHLIVEVTDSTTGQSMGRSMNIIDIESESHGDLERRYSHLIDIVQTAKQLEE